MGDAELGLGDIPFGANGIAFDAGQRYLYVANTNFGRIVRIPVEADGGAGKAEVFVEDPDLLGGADGIAFHGTGNLYVAVNGPDRLAVISPDGTISTLAEGGALDFPASIIFGVGEDQDTLYITNFSALRAQGLKPGTARPALLKIKDLGIGDQRDVIVAHGTLAVDTPLTCFPPAVTTGCISIQTVDGGSKTIFIGDYFITQSGNLPGHIRELQMVTIDGPIRTASIRGLFTGSVGGKVGTYGFVGSNISDLSLVPDGGPVMFQGNWAIVEGSGTGAFEGVCGFATFSLNDVIIPGVTLPDITNVLVFGDDCEDFDVGDFLDILNDE